MTTRRDLIPSGWSTAKTGWRPEPGSHWGPNVGALRALCLYIAASPWWCDSRSAMEHHRGETGGPPQPQAVGSRMREALAEDNRQIFKGRSINFWRSPFFGPRCHNLCL